MQQQRHRWTALALLLLCGSAPLLQAQTAELAACRAIAEREARFECYDRVEALQPPAPAAAAAPVTAPAVTAAAPESAPVAAATPAPTVEDFGKPAARLEQGAEGQVELVDRVASLKLVQHKQWQLTLESGQVWQQVLSQTYNLKAGHEVRLTPINDGPNHRLSSPQLAGSIQVRRLR